MHDDLYAQNVHAFFSRNSLLQLDTGVKPKDNKDIKINDDRDSFRDAVRYLGKEEGGRNMHNRLCVQMLDRSLQSYLRDAEYYLSLKVFKAEVTYRDPEYDKKHIVPYYFVNRLELSYTRDGNRRNESVYQKLKGIKGVLNAKTRAEVLVEEKNQHCPGSIEEVQKEIDKDKRQPDEEKKSRRVDERELAEEKREGINATVKVRRMD